MNAFAGKIRGFPVAVPFYLALWVAAAAAIIAVTWPWAGHFTGEMLKHWDPPFHAWKLSYMANRILAGDPLFSSPDTNLIYPHAGALYFEALCWPCAVVFAVLRRLTSWPVELVYHVTLIGFWSLSAPSAGLLLRRLGVGRILAFAFGVIWCILPYRMSYANEFQMQMAFMIPLFYMAFESFMERPGVFRGVLTAFAWYFFAITELYQAFFILFTLPFIVAAHVRNESGFFRRRGLWYGCAAAVLAGLALMPFMLFPYLRYQAAGDVARSLGEIARHSIQPFSWIKPFGVHAPWDVDAKLEEFHAYPTLLLIALTAAASAAWIRRRTPTFGKADGLFVLSLPVSLALFGAMTTLHHCRGCIGKLPEAAWGLSALLSVAAAVLFVFVKSGTMKERFLMGLAGASVFCFFMSFGPTLDGRAHVTAGTLNPVYMFVLKLIPPVASFRAACRFGVFTHFFMLVASALFLQRVCGKARAGRVFFAVVLGAASVSAAWIEAVPPPQFLHFMPVDVCESSPVVRRLADKIKNDGHQSFVLARMPMGSRMSDGMAMLSLFQDRFLSMHAWCGYIPPFSAETAMMSKTGDFPGVSANLAKIWPPCFVIVDKSDALPASRGYSDAFPQNVTRSGNGAFIVDFVAAFRRNGWVERMKDDRFTLLECVKAHEGKVIEKVFRCDFAERFPVVRAQLSGPSGTTVAVLLNGNEIFRSEIGGGPSDIVVRMSPEYIRRTGRNVLAFSADDRIVLRSFCLEKAEDR